MAFNYQNDIDSKMENYPVKPHDTERRITSTLLTSACHAHPQTNTNRLAIYVAEYIAEAYKIDIKLPPPRP